MKEQLLLVYVGYCWRLKKAGGIPFFPFQKSTQLDFEIFRSSVCRRALINYVKQVKMYCP